MGMRPSRQRYDQDTLRPERDPRDARRIQELEQENTELRKERIAGSSEANIFRDNSTRRAGRVAGKRPRSPRTDRKDAAGVLDVRPAKPMVGKAPGTSGAGR